MKRLLSILALAAPVAHAQCVMCFRTAAAQNLERAHVMNIGIGVMLVPPVLILGGFLYLAYRRNLSYADPDTETPLQSRDRKEADDREAARRRT